MSETSIEKNYVSLEQKDLLLNFLTDSFELDFTQYSEASVRRRIAKILNELRLKDVEEYIDFLNKESNGRDLFLQKFTVNVTEMFRDPFAFEALVEKVFPRWAEMEKVRIWSAGCSSGEEIISLAILLKERNLLDKCEIWATDISESILAQAREACFKMRHILTYEKPYRDAGGQKKLSDHYTVVNENACFDDSLFQQVKFDTHNLMDAPDEGDFDLVLCRNVLIYFNATLQNQVLKRIDQTIKKKGLLVLGSKESLIFYSQHSRFSEIEPETKIYQKL